MKYFRNNNNWLRYKVNAIINNNHKDLEQTTWEKLYKSSLKYAFDKKRWWLIIIVILLIYFIGIVINIRLLNFIDIKLDTAKIIVDQRTSNTATIISMTLAVVGFLMSNLAVKESFAYRLLFKNSKLYPIIYFTLGIIGSLILISLFRDTIKPEYIFSRLVLTGSYLVLVVLLLIGYLFRSIIHFTNSKRIKDLLHAELISESKLNLRESLFKKYSRKVYDDIMITSDAKEYNFFESFSSTSLSDSALETEDAEILEIKGDELFELFPKQKLLEDVNISRLTNFLFQKKSHGKIYYRRLALGESTSETNNYIWLHTTPNTQNEKKYLHKCLILKKEISSMRISNDVRKYFDQKLEEYSYESKHRDLDELLKSYLEIYELEMTNKIDG